MVSLNSVPDSTLVIVQLLSEAKLKIRVPNPYRLCEGGGGVSESSTEMISILLSFIGNALIATTLPN